jgi:hypothetical protein
MRQLFFCCLSLAPLTGCANQENTLSAYPELKHALEEFQIEQARFYSQNPTPITYEFADAGRVTVRDISLDGYPGNTYVRAKFHYQNTTGKPVVRALVSLDVLDADKQMVASKVSVLIVPVAVPIASGAYFADELSTLTMNAHLHPGWSWRITCRAQFEEPVDERFEPPARVDPGPIILKPRQPRIIYDW